MTAAAAPSVKPWLEVVALHPDVLAENFSEDIFALDLGPLADDSLSVPAVYRDAEHFFRASYLTRGLRSLLEDTLSRLAGGGGNRVMKLVTPFGGGKSHTLAALFHAGRHRAALDAVPEAAGLAKPGSVRTAVFDGQFFDAVNGKEVPGQGFRARTLWGWIAWSLGGEPGYKILRQQDEARVAPGADEVIKLLGAGPNLILLDEVLNYLISAGGINIQDTTLRDETLAFLQRLTAAVGNSPNSVVVFSLQSSKRESLEYTSLLQTLDHLAARKDQLREPVEGDEVLEVIRRRLLGRQPTPEDATPAARAFQETVTQMRRAYAATVAERESAERDGIALRDRIRAAYPFHPALIDLMRERWAAIPDFQRTRGALRFLAACLRADHRENRSRALLGPGDVPLSDAEVRLAFFKEVGQQADFQPVFEHDLTGTNARARRIDERRAKETPAESARRPATRLATAILMYSFGGLQRPGAGGADLLPPGISEPELLQACVGPDLDSTTALACLKELKDQCLYLHFDGVRYCFKKDPNVTLLVEQEADAVSRSEQLVAERIQEMVEQRVSSSGAHNAYIWPGRSADVPDRQPEFLLAYLPLDFAGKPKQQREQLALELFEKCGDRPRQYRNALGLAVPSGAEVEGLRRSVRYILAIERVREKARQHNLTDEQKAQLNEKQKTEEGAAEAALLKLYTEVWLPKRNGGLSIETISIGGRPIAARLNEQKRARIHDRLMEMLVDIHRRVFATLAPSKVIELSRLGQGSPPASGAATAEIRDGFFSILGFTRLRDDSALRQAIAKGCQGGLFGYYAGPAPELQHDKYQVAPEKVRIGTPVGQDEVDLDGGFLMLPQFIPGPPAGTEGGALALTAPAGGEAAPPGAAPAPSPTAGAAGAPAGRRDLDLTLRADSNGLYKAWSAIANLADMAGEVTVSVHAEAAGGLDESRLRNGVLEPLKEAGLIEE